MILIFVFIELICVSDSYILSIFRNALSNICFYERVLFNLYLSRYQAQERIFIAGGGPQPSGLRKDKRKTREEKGSRNVIMRKLAEKHVRASTRIMNQSFL